MATITIDVNASSLYKFFAVISAVFAAIADVCGGDLAYNFALPLFGLIGELFVTQ